MGAKLQQSQLVVASRECQVPDNFCIAAHNIIFITCTCRRSPPPRPRPRTRPAWPPPGCYCLLLKNLQVIADQTTVERTTPPFYMYIPNQKLAPFFASQKLFSKVVAGRQAANTLTNQKFDVKLCCVYFSTIATGSIYTSRHVCNCGSTTLM